MEVLVVFGGAPSPPAWPSGGAPALSGRVRRGRLEVEFSMGPTKPARAVHLSGSELHRLLELRELIKVESFRLPAARQRELLELLERSRPWRTPPPPLPEMSRAELARAISWRLGTVSLPVAAAAGELLKRPRRRTPRR